MRFLLGNFIAKETCESDINNDFGSTYRNAFRVAWVPVAESPPDRPPTDYSTVYLQNCVLFMLFA